MTLLHPYPPNPEYAPWSVGELPSVWSESRYVFTTHEALVDHFSQWLGQDFIIATIENEKQVFMVRKDVSLEETRLQFLKKCESRLLKALSQIQRGPRPHL
jgi:hypothetical protein